MNRNPESIPERLIIAEQDLRRIRKVTDPAVQRAMLGGLLFDLVALDKAMIREGCTASDLNRWQALAQIAWGLQGELGPPSGKTVEEESGHEPPAASAPAPLREAPRRRQRQGVRRSPGASKGGGRNHRGPSLWRWLGFTPRAVTGLERANIRSLEDLRRLNGDQILEIRGIGPRELERCEKLLSVTLPRRSDYWTSRGISIRTTRFLLRAGIENLEILERTTREAFLLGYGLGEGALRECEALLGRPLASPEEDWMRAGCTRRHLARKLSRVGIFTCEDLQKKKDDDLLRAGLSWREVDECYRLVRRWKAKESPEKPVS